MEFPTLSNLIFAKLSIEDLYNSYKETNIIAIEMEIENRLKSNNPKIYIPVINYLYENIYDEIVKKQWLKSIYIVNGIKCFYPIPWKIGVIYDYRDQSYRINNILILVGHKMNYKTNEGQKFYPSWMNSEDTKLALREVISSHAHPVNKVISVVTHDPKLDNKIHNILTTNNSVTITTCKFLAPIGGGIHSYPDMIPLSHSEMKQVYPCYLKSDTFEHKLIDYHGNIDNYYPQEYHVKITKSKEVPKLLTLFGLV